MAEESFGLPTAAKSDHELRLIKYYAELIL